MRVRMRTRISAVALTIGLSLGLASAVSAATSAAAAPAGFVGMVVDGPLLDPHVNLAHELNLMVASGVESLRFEFNWRLVQPYANFGEVPVSARAAFQNVGGIPTSFRPIDRVVGLAAQRGLPILAVVTDVPDWAARHPGLQGSPPASSLQYAKFVKALVRRYGHRGSFWRANPAIKPLPIRSWQIWNEPSIPYGWSDQPFAADYVALLRAARAAIKNADPGARVVLAGLPNDAWASLASIYKIRGARPLFDVVDAHPYTSSPERVIAFLKRVRDVMNRAGDKGKPLLASEMGWPSSVGKTTTFGFETTESGQARDIAAILPMLAHDRRPLGLIGFDYYTWVGDEYPGAFTFNFAGLLRSHFDHFTAKPALGAFRRAALAIEGCKEKGGIVASPCLPLRTRHVNRRHSGHVR